MNEEVKIEKEEKKTVRDTLYGRIDVSVKTMDKVLMILFILLTFSLIVGILI